MNTNIAKKIQEYENFRNILNGANLDSQSFDGNPFLGRNVCALLSIAQEHAGASLILMQKDMYTSSANLIRSIIETYLRGLWLWKCNPNHITKINKCYEYLESANQKIQDAKFPPFKNLYEDVTKSSEIENGLKPDIQQFDTVRKLLHDYTHTGVVSIYKWINSDYIEPNFTDKEKDELLNAVATMNRTIVIAISQFISDEKVLEKIEKYLTKTNTNQ